MRLPRRRRLSSWSRVDQITSKDLVLSSAYVLFLAELVGGPQDFILHWDKRPPRLGVTIAFEDIVRAGLLIILTARAGSRRSLIHCATVSASGKLAAGAVKPGANTIASNQGDILVVCLRPGLAFFPGERLTPDRRKVLCIDPTSVCQFFRDRSGSTSHDRPPTSSRCDNRPSAWVS